ncbi:signal peptidase I [Terrabacter sp. NPDC080008]|uniref:signal peptidase I n=1 Tax=Terrabacter sp. NPDC080008 TaxID=3155176 RepID=UPI00344E3027
MARQHTQGVGALRRLSRWAVNLVVFVVIAACAAWLVPSLMGYSRYVITGGSMTGTYDKGSIVLEKPVAVHDLKVGDVITYLPPADSGVANLVTHRILAMKPAAGGGTVFTTKGDANPKPDPWHFTLVSQEQPLVQLGVPHAGWVLIALADRNTRMMLIGGPAALIALVALGQLAGAARPGTRRREAAKAPTATVAAAPAG